MPASGAPAGSCRPGLWRSRLFLPSPAGSGFSPTFWGVCPGRLCRDGSFPDRRPRPIDSPPPVRPASRAGHDPAAGNTLNTKTDQPNPNLRPMTKIVLKFLLLLFSSFSRRRVTPIRCGCCGSATAIPITNDMPSTVRQIAATQKVKLSCTRFPAAASARPPENQKLLDAIAAGGWDYVILQEQSSAPAMPTRQVARKFLPCGAYARQPGARRVARCPCDLLHDVGGIRTATASRFRVPARQQLRHHAGAVDYQLPRNGLRQRCMVCPRGHGMAPGACRKARLRALCAGLFPPRNAGQLPPRT